MIYNIKNSIFLNLTPRQKSMLLSYIKEFTKKNKDLSADVIIDKFIEDENYYYELNNPHFEFVIDNFSDEKFLSDLKKYINSIFYEIEQKERLKPLIEKQKEIQKEQRQKANDYKMSKLKPTKKQISYYKSLSGKNDTENATRLDLKNWIAEILDEQKRNNTDLD